MKFHVVGVGPLGSLFAHHLRRATPPAHSIIFLHSHPKHARDGPVGFNIQTSGAVTTSSGFDHDILNPERASEIDSLFVTTRAHSTLHVLRRLAPRLSPHSTVVLVQNGLAVYDEIVETIFRNPQQRPHFIFASSTHDTFYSAATTAEKTRPAMLHRTVGKVDFAIAKDPYGRDFEGGFAAGAGQERRGRLSDVANPEDDPAFPRYRSLRNTVAALLLAEPLNTRWRPLAPVQVVLQRKVVVNSVLHTLSALMGCRTRDIFSTPYAVRTAKKICQEASDVYQAQLNEEAKAWMATSESEVGGALGIARLPRTLEASSLLKECSDTSRGSRDSISGMLSAVRHGRRTEIDFLNGYLLRLGRTYNVPMPATSTIYNLIRMRSAIPIDQFL